MYEIVKGRVLMKKHIKYIVAVIVVILIIVLLVTLNIKRNNQKKEESNITKIVNSFYPMYIMAENLTDGASNVELENMADVNVGCLHDYTLMTEDIKKVENADIFISNGLGMESFINKLIEANSNMKIIDSSKSITNVIKSEEETNPHIWTSIDNYILQVQTISDSLKEYNAENSEVYEKNAEKYVEELTELKNKYKEELAFLEGRKAVCLNEAFEYMGEELGLELLTVQTDHEESTMSAEMLKNIINTVKEENIEIIIIDKNDNEANAETIANETGVKIYKLNSGLTGNLEKDAYIKQMEENIEILKSAK